MAVYKPPQNIAERDKTKKSVFLAGSIEMGNAVDWQTNLGNFFDDSGWDVFNPRREKWESTEKQSFENPMFYQQVNWELNALEAADLIVMNFDPKTQSPISLMELGLFARTGKLHVICPEGFWRKGNVDVVCNYYGIPLYETLASFTNKLESL
jgi:hypothetical protein